MKRNIEASDYTAFIQAIPFQIYGILTIILILERLYQRRIIMNKI